MALLFCDSFDHYTTIAQALFKWTTINQGGGAVSIGAFGRNGTNGMRITRSDDVVSKTIPGGTKTSVVVGVACKLNALSGTWNLVGVYEGSNTQCLVQVRIDGKVQVATPGGTAIGTKVLSDGVFYYFELKVTIGNVGSYELRINGATELANGAVDTQAGANAFCDNIKFANGVNIGGEFVDYDDFYLCDTLGGVNDNFLGDIRVTAIFPNGIGANSQWTPVAGANYTNVYEATPNDDTDYVYSATVGQVDTYAFTNLSASVAIIKAIQWIGYARKDDAGLRQIAPVIWQGGVPQVGATQTLGTTYTFYPVIFDTNPHTAAAFTLSEINGDEFGVKVIA